MKRLLFLLLLGGAGALLVREYVLEGIYIATASMEPTLPIGRHVFINKFVYRLRDPERGEVVAVRVPWEGKDVVKRIIAIPGDVIEGRVEGFTKKVYLNGQPLQEPYVQLKMGGMPVKGDRFGPYTLPPNHYFVMGDNRDESKDSRDWVNPDTGQPAPFVPGEAILGKVIGVY